MRLRFFRYTFFLIFLLIPTNLFASEKLKVATSLPLLKEFTERVGGERVEVKSILTGFESEHSYTPKPSNIILVREARIFIQIGAGLEVWVDALVKNAGNKGLIIVTTSEGIPLLKDTESAQNQDRQNTPDGQNTKDKHRLGNPHVWLDPENAKIMLKKITDALIRIDPDNKGYYLGNQAAYIREIDDLQKMLVQEIRQIKDRRIITHHQAWPYFARRFGFTISGNIIEQVGSEPSARHLADLVRTIRREKIKVIVSEPQLNQKIPKTLADETGARLITLTPIPGAIPGTETYLSMVKYNVGQLMQALRN